MANEQCRLPSRGWVCYLTSGHDGPCPAYRSGLRARVARRLMPVLERWHYGF